MKKYIYIGLLLTPITLKAQTINYNLKGQVAKLKSPAKAYLTYRGDGGNVTDSAMIQNGTFEFKSTYTNPVKATLTVTHKGESSRPMRDADQLPVYLETGNIIIIAADSVSKASISGSKLNKTNQELTRLLFPYTNKINAAEAAYRALPKEQKTDKAADSLDKQTTAIEDSQKGVLADFIKGHSNSLISLDALKTYGGYFPEATEVEPLFNTLSAGVKSGAAGTQYNKWLQGWKLTAIGANAPLFSQNDKEGKAVSLTSFKGKYVLVDFWASWCGPCRRENPGIVKTFEQFKDKNFTILGVSLDSKREAWLKAVEDDKLNWTQVSDLKYWKNEVAEQYGVRAIPQNFLIDPSGKVIAKNLNGEDLAIKLGNIFNAGTSTENGTKSR